MEFSQPAYGNGCELDFDVPFKKLLPMMTADGRAAVLGIMHGMR
jgi:hypothetical protein